MKFRFKNAAAIIILTALFTAFPMLTSPVWAEYTLANNERVVTSFEELKDALGSDNGITTVYFGADITMKTPGIAIHSSKTNVVVSGINPLNPDQSAPYTLTDFLSSTQSYTIYINNSGVKNLLVRDLKIIGKNYYGSFNAYDVLATNGLVITYQRVNYSGPQMGYNRRGTLRLIDCTVSINGNNGGSANQEFSEAKNLIFEGNNAIDTVTSATGVFWQPTGGTFEIADGSSLTVTALNMGTTYGMYYADGGNISISIGKNAAFQATISGTVNRYSQAVLNTITVHESGIFHLETKKTATDTIMSAGSLAVGKRAEFTMRGYGGAGAYLLAQRTGDITVGEGATFHLFAENAYSSLLALYGRSLICNDPFSVLLYNPAGRVVQSVTTAGKIHIEAQQINDWTAAGTGGFDDPPKYHWYKADGSQFVIDGTIDVGTDEDFSALSSNYAEGDSPGTAPSIDTFKIASTRVLAFGRLDLIIFDELDKAPVLISGKTGPGAAVRASYARDGGDSITPSAVADSHGYYSIPLDSALEPNTIVIVRSNLHYLTAVSSVSVIPERIELTIPEKLIFDPAKVASKSQTVRRADSSWGVTVANTRGVGSNYRLFVRAPIPMTLQNSPGFILEHALVYVNDAGVATPLDAAEILLIYQHTALSDLDITDIRWDRDRGILAHIPPGAVLKGNYLGSLEWILADAP